MYATTDEELAEIRRFASLAAKRFAESPDAASFSLKTPSAGCLVALRWGLMDRSVLVFRVDDKEPILFRDLIQQEE